MNCISTSQNLYQMHTCEQLLMLSVAQKNNQIKMYTLMGKMELKFHLCFSMSIVFCILFVYLILNMDFIHVSRADVKCLKVTEMSRFLGQFY